MSLPICIHMLRAVCVIIVMCDYLDADVTRHAGGHTALLSHYQHTVTHWHWSALIYATLHNDTLVTAMDTGIEESQRRPRSQRLSFFVQIFFCFSSKVKTETKNVMILIHVIH